jgi:uncharacterized membrane protein YhaH (DUF805 family)
MNLLAPVLYLFDWRGVLARGVYRRNLAILYLTNALLIRLHLFTGGSLVVWGAVVLAIGLSFDARRFHDMGFSAAWIVWIYLIGGGFICVAIVVLPDLGDYVPRPTDPGLRRIVDSLPWRIFIPIVVGSFLISVVRRIWLVTGPSMTTQNPYAKPQTLFWKAQEAEEGPDETAVQAIIDRRLEERRREALQGAPTPQPASATPLAARRQFGRRGL